MRTTVALELGLSALSLFAFGCSAPVPVGESASPIIGGTKDTGDPAVVLVIAQGNQGDAMCTGEVVSPHVVLTAAHCVDPATVGSGNTFQIFLGADDNDAQQANDPSLYVDVASTHFDPQFDPNQLEAGHDVAVVITKTAIPVTPLPMNRVALDPSDVGAPIRLVGYGITSGSDQNGTTAGTKRQVGTTLGDFDGLLLNFTDGRHNTCEGDSGGPAFLVKSGVEVIAGITSFGDQGCTQGGSDTRIDVYVSGFVDPYIAKYDPAPPTPPVEVPDMATAPAPSPDLAQAPAPTVNDAPDLLPPSSEVDLLPAPEAADLRPTAPAPTVAPPDMAHAHLPPPGGGGTMGGPAAGSPSSGTSGGMAAVNASCGGNGDCASGACAQGGGGGYCTKVCDPAKAASCPSGMSCGAIDSAHYCVRVAAQATGGCSVGARAPAGTPLLLLALALVLALRRKSRRS